MTTRLAIGILCIVLMLGGWASALILVGRGNDPVRDDHWPIGAVDVANLKTRVGWWEGPPFGGGQHQFLYRGDEKALQQAIDLFAKIKWPALKLVVHEGPQHNEFLKDPKDPKSDTSVDWTFTVWNTERWEQLYGTGKKGIALADDPNFGKPMDPPTLDVFVSEGRIDWSKVKVPAGIDVTDERSSAVGAVGSLIRGGVVDLTTSKPISGAEVSVSKRESKGDWEPVATGKSDGQGRYEVRDIPAGTYMIWASAPGYAARVLGYAQFGKNTLKQFSASLAPEASVSGTITDTDGKPVKGARVRTGSLVAADGRGYTCPKPAEAISDDRGHFELTGLPRGIALLFVYHDHFQQLDVLKKYDVPSQDLSLRLTATGGIMGKVIAADAKLLGQRQVSINIGALGDPIGKWGGSTTVNPDGSFMFDNVPPGRYVLSTKPMFPGAPKDPNAEEIDVHAGKTTAVQITYRG